MRPTGLSNARVREYLPYRMLDVEVRANTVYAAWAAEEILARLLAGERPVRRVRRRGPSRSAGLRYRAHDKLTRAFLDDDVYDGRVRIAPKPRAQYTGLPARRPGAATGRPKQASLQRPASYKD